MGGPDGRSLRERMIRSFFVAGTSPAVQTKVLEMMLRAPEATAVGAMNATREPARQTTDMPTNQEPNTSASIVRNLRRDLNPAFVTELIAWTGID